MIKTDAQLALSIRDYIPSFLNLRNFGGNNYFLNALYTAVDEQVEISLANAEEASKQLFIATATGKYLINLGATEGFVVPTDAGLDSDAFRLIVPAITSSPKQVIDTIVKTMSIFYDKTRINPYITSEKSQPYSLSDGDNLIITTENGDINVSFLSSQVSDISNISAAEIAGIINSSQNKVQADVYLSRDTNQYFCRLTSVSYGTGAFIQVTGGTAQNKIQFPPICRTQQIAGTTWNISKTESWTDIVRFVWNGTLPSPALYNVNVGDFVSIRDLPSPYDTFNGSFVIQNVGYENIGGIDYDYFEIKNFRYPSTSGTIVLPNADSMVFTQNKKRRIFDADEYAVVSETNPRSVSIVVPAVPQILRKELKSSAHFHGWVAKVVDITRLQIVINKGLLDSVPKDINTVVLGNKSTRFDARHFYKTVARSDVLDPIYTLSIDPEYNVLPYVDPTAIERIDAEVGSSELLVTFGYKHGLRNKWGFTLAGCAGSENITPSLLNAEHKPCRLVGESQLLFKVVDANGNPIKYSGVPFNGFDLYQSEQQGLAYDFVLDFHNQAGVLASGLEIGSVFKFGSGTIMPGQTVLANSLSQLKMQVVNIRNGLVYAFSGLGTTFSMTMVASSCTGYRSSEISGGGATYFFDKTSTYNKEFVLSGLQAYFCEYTDSSNPDFVGGYIFDPDGVKFPYVVGNPVTQIQSEIIKGSNLSVVLVDDVQGFPLDGHLFFEYGTDRAEGPIRYLSVSSQDGADQIVVDPAYIFKFNHERGSQVQRVMSLSKYTPKSNGEDYPVYITGTVQARNFFFTLLQQVVAAGVFISENVIYPNTRYQDPSLNPYD